MEKIYTRNVLRQQKMTAFIVCWQSQHTNENLIVWFIVRGDNASSLQESHLMAISDVMKDTLKKHKTQFELLR